MLLPPQTALSVTWCLSVLHVHSLGSWNTQIWRKIKLKSESGCCFYSEPCQADRDYGFYCAKLWTFMSKFSTSRASGFSDVRRLISVGRAVQTSGWHLVFHYSPVWSVRCRRGRPFQVILPKCGFTPQVSISWKVKHATYYPLLTLSITHMVESARDN